MRINQYIKWVEYSKKLNKEMQKFDKEYMRKHRNHKCKTRENFDDGTWYCNHLINSRTNKFRRKLEIEENLLKKTLNQ